MNKKTKWIIISASLLFVVLIVLSKTGVFGKEEGTKVTAEKATRRTIIETVNASGKVYPEIEVKVSPDISGEITELTVQEGDTVKKGQLLARIYADIYSIQRDQASFGVDQTKAQAANTQAALDALQAQLDQSQRNYDRQKKLYDEKVISKSEFDVAESTFKTAKANHNAAVQTIKGANVSVKTAEASLNRANKDLDKTVIVAPMDGVISLLNVKKGEKVAGNSFNIGTEILRIANMDKIEVRVDVGENDIPKVKLGDSAIVTIDAFSERKFRGIVTQIASSNNGASTSALAPATNDVTQYKVYVRILPESYMDLIGKGYFPFKPGMSANADIQTRTSVNVLSVPINAVTTREKKDAEKIVTTGEDGKESSSIAADDLDVVVFVKGKDGQIRKVKVTTGIQDINHIEIISGLQEGDEIITGPYNVVSKELKDSLQVKIVEKKELIEEKK